MIGAPIAGWSEGFAVAQLDRDGRVFRLVSSIFEAREDAERVRGWKRRARRDLAVVQYVNYVRVLA